MPSTESTPILTHLPACIDCQSCGRPVEAEPCERERCGSVVRLRCDCGRTSWYDIGDFLRIGGKWHEVGPTCAQ